MKNNAQLINAILIIGGGILLLTKIFGKGENVYLLIIGIVLLMFGLFRATNHWAYTKDDHKNEDNNENN